jgi:hypothetical protein
MLHANTGNPVLGLFDKKGGGRVATSSAYFLSNEPGTDSEKQS